MCSGDPSDRTVSNRPNPTTWEHDTGLSISQHAHHVECFERPPTIYFLGAEFVIIGRKVQPRLLVASWLFGVLSLCEMAEAGDHPAFQPVKELFAAMSKHDGEAMQQTSTDDFQLLEHGEVWTMQKLIDAVQPKGKPYERKNFFRQIDARQQGNMAWVSYWNKAEIHRDDATRTVVWLESAVMIQKDDRWQIQLMHSTRLDPDKHPKDIQWVPFLKTP